MGEIEHLISLKFSQSTKFTLITFQSNLDEEREEIQLASTHFAKQCEIKNLDYRIVTALDLVSYRIMADLPLSQLIKLAVTKNQIDISSDGQTLLYPLHPEDFIDGVFRATFLSNTRGHVYTIGGPETTDLDLAFQLKDLFQKKNLNLDINQSKQNVSNISHVSSIDQTSTGLNWSNKHDFFTFITKDFLDVNYTNINKALPSQNIKTKIFSYFLLLFFLIAILQVIASFSGYALLYLSSKQSQRSLTALRSGNPQQSRLLISSTKRKLAAADSLVSLTSPFNRLIVPKFITNLEIKTNALHMVIPPLDNLTNIYDLGLKTYQDFFSKRTLNIVPTAQTLTAHLESLSQQIDQILISSDATANNTSSISTEDLKKIRKQIVNTLSFLDIIKNQLRYKANSRIVFVLLDNSYYQYIGGRPKAIVTMSIQDNKLASIVTDDFETDLNLSLFTDLTSLSPILESEISQKTNTNPDMIILLTPLTIANYLQYYPGLHLDLNIPITSQNILDTLSLPNNRSSPLIPQISKEIIRQVQSDPKAATSFFRSFIDSQTNNDIWLHSTNPTVQKLIDSYKQAGDLSSSNCPAVFDQNKCLTQSIQINEDSLSTNVSSLAHTRMLNIEVEISPDTINKKLRLIFTPKADKFPPGLSYNSVLRVYLSKQDLLTSLTIDNKPMPISPSSVGTNLNEYRIAIEPTSSSASEITLRTTTPLDPIIARDNFSYALSLARQPGVLNYRTKINIAYPNSITPLVISHPATTTSNLVSFNEADISSTIYAISFKIR